MAQSAALEIKQLLLQKKNLLLEIRDVTSEQFSILKQDNIDVLMDNIAKRQALIDSIDALDAQMIALCEGLTYGDDNEKMAFIKRLFPDVWGEISATLEEILSQDKQNEAKALKVMDDYKSQIRETGETRSAAEGYLSGEVQAGGAYFDSKN